MKTPQSWLYIPLQIIYISHLFSSYNLQSSIQTLHIRATHPKVAIRKQEANVEYKGEIIFF